MTELMIARQELCQGLSTYVHLINHFWSIFLFNYNSSLPHKNHRFSHLNPVTSRLGILFTEDDPPTAVLSCFLPLTARPATSRDGIHFGLGSLASPHLPVKVPLLVPDLFSGLRNTSYLAHQSPPPYYNTLCDNRFIGCSESIRNAFIGWRKPVLLSLSSPRDLSLNRHPLATLRTS